jgi:hypothetical protein
MEKTKEQVEQAILFFAKAYNLENNYRSIMSTRPGLPKIVEMIVYELFIHRFNSYHCSDEEYEQYKIIHEYVTELREIGWVEFK